MKESYRNDVDGDYKKSIKNENNLSLLFFGIIVITIINIINVFIPSDKIIKDKFFLVNSVLSKLSTPNFFTEGENSLL